MCLQCHRVYSTNNTVGTCPCHHTGILQQKFTAYAKAQRALLMSKSKFNLFLKLAYHYNFRPMMMTFIMTPMVLAKSQSSTGAQQSTLARQVSSVQTVFSQMILALASLGEFLTQHAVHQQHNRSTFARVVQLHDELEKLNHRAIKADDRIYSFDDNRVEFKEVLVTTPTSQVLVEKLSFALQKGGSLLITGHNGAGKSSIFRCLGGLWKVTEGSITKPSKEIFYIPQKPYQFLGTLRENICYPHLDSLENLTDDRVKELLGKVGLGHLIAQSSDRSINWSDRLGLGEQQRLAMVSSHVLTVCSGTITLLFLRNRRLFMNCSFVHTFPYRRDYFTTSPNLRSSMSALLRSTGKWRRSSTKNASDLASHTSRSVIDLR